MALTDNLLAFYKLSDLTDSSGNNRTLTNNGNVSFASGKLGNAAVFDGNGGFISNYDLANLNSEYTQSIWIKSTEQGVAHIFSGELPYIYAYSGSVVVGAAGGNDNFVSGILDDQWHHLVVTVKNNELNYFVDGQKSQNSYPLNFTTGQGNLSIGQYNNGGYNFNGQIDAVGIWNRALSDSEVAALYNSGNGLELEIQAQPTLVKMQAPVKLFGKIKFGV